MTSPASKLLRVMIDANLLVAGTAWPRFPYAVMQHATQQDYHLVLSSQIIEEAQYSLAKIPQQYKTGARSNDFLPRQNMS